jgi:hypothetical protein
VGRVHFRRADGMDAAKAPSFWARLRSWFSAAKPDVTDEPVKTDRKVIVHTTLTMKKCDACGGRLRLQPFVTCPSSKHHNVHTACVEQLTKGKCPVCGHSMMGNDLAQGA